MDKEKKIKIFLALTYLLIICIFLWFFFNNYSLSEITSYEFIKNNREKIMEFKKINLFLVSVIFFVSTIAWVMLLGFGTPICLLAGFIFGKWFGTIIVSLSLSIGATLLYAFANFFFKEIIAQKFSNKFIFLYEKFKKKEFIYFLIYRFIGGIPFFISNIIPTLFNIKMSNFFLGSVIGLTPQIFIWVSLGSGLDKVIKKNIEAPSLYELFSSSEIYIPIIGFIVLLIIGMVIKNLFYKN
tara:strand:+ start:57 stop:776 length:720 start_codon:yes stop_codon:yes gene_type:complete